MYKNGTMYCIVLYLFLYLYYQLRKIYDIHEVRISSFTSIKIKFGMARKYLLTLSLAAISCLATKSIQGVLEIEQKEEQEQIIELVNSEIPEIKHQAELVLE